MWPPSTPPADVPAQVVELPAARTVRIAHISGDIRHENVVATVARYRARGWTCDFVTSPAALVVPLSKPLTRRVA
jgi:hypothetical protein